MRWYSHQRVMGRDLIPERQQLLGVRNQFCSVILYLFLTGDVGCLGITTRSQLTSPSHSTLPFFKLRLSIGWERPRGREGHLLPRARQKSSRLFPNGKSHGLHLKTLQINFTDKIEYGEKKSAKFNISTDAVTFSQMYFFGSIKTSV